ncbi:methyltransferase C-terminal domain-containing protein [Afipia sp. DC4300-2b1]|uniref:methyltransferase C-terminal domain-containing protein n=1 Tax=Afipia sp. DC4300-2b1 TaxID=2804672 RepID=UPI003CF75DE1
MRTTHGGSLRVFGCHTSDQRPSTTAVATILKREADFGLLNEGLYRDFQAKAEKIKNDLLSFLIEKKRQGKMVAAYGAAAKGNTLLNFAGVKPDLVSFVCDAALSKQNKFLPGSHIPILAPAAIDERKPDYVLILPWNISDEIRTQLSQVSNWGGQFVVAAPELKVI